MRRTLASAAATGLTALALLTGPGTATAAPGQPTATSNDEDGGSIEVAALHVYLNDLVDISIGDISLGW